MIMVAHLSHIYIVDNVGDSGENSSEYVMMGLCEAICGKNFNIDLFSACVRKILQILPDANLGYQRGETVSCILQ